MHVLAGIVNDGEAGNTTKLAEPSQPDDAYFATQQPAVVGLKTPVEGSIVPPPVTDQEPPEPPVCVKVTLPPPTQELVVVTFKVGVNGMSGESKLIEHLLEVKLIRNRVPTG